MDISDIIKFIKEAAIEKIYARSVAKCNLLK